MYKRCFNDVFILNINDLCPDSCRGQGECKKEIGCVCSPGFSSHDCSEKVKCKDDCSNHGLCHNNAKCGCFPGFTGVVCNNIIPCLRNCTDFANGVCQNDATCKCKPGFTGKDCSEYTTIGNNTLKEEDPFKSLTAITAKKIRTVTAISCPKGCSNHGKCNTTIGVCSCDQGYSGSGCNLLAKRLNGDDDSEDDKTTTQNKTLKANNTDDSEDDKSNSTSSNSTKQSELKNTKVYQTGRSDANYYVTNDCSNSCSKKGLCLNSTCFCEQGSTSQDCSMTYKDFMEQGLKFNDMKKFMIAAFGIAFVMTFISLLSAKSARNIKSDHLDI